MKTNGWGMFACKIGKKYGRGYPDRRRVPFYNFPLVFREVQGKKRKVAFHPTWIRMGMRMRKSRMRRRG